MVESTSYRSGYLKRDRWFCQKWGYVYMCNTANYHLVHCRVFKTPLISCSIKHLIINSTAIEQSFTDEKCIKSMLVSNKQYVTDTFFNEDRPCEQDFRYSYLDSNNMQGRRLLTAWILVLFYKHLYKQLNPTYISSLVCAELDNRNFGRIIHGSEQTRVVFQ